jgi:hypothetical protein
MYYQKLIRLVGVCLVLVCVSFVLVSAKDKPPDGIPDAGKTKWITVDCTKGESINDALGDTAEQLYIEIHGMCTEQVVVNRDNVFLLGTPDDDGPDGITAPILPDPWIDVWPQLQHAIEIGLTDNVALLIRDSRYVYVGQDLTFELGPNVGGWGAVRVVDSLVAFEDCDILNSRGIGMVIEDSTILAGGLDLTGCNIPAEQDMCFGGLMAVAGSHLLFSGGPEPHNVSNITYEGGNEVVGLRIGVGDEGEVMGSAYADLEDIDVSAPVPLLVENGSTLELERAIVTRFPANGGVALRVYAGSEASLENVKLRGAFFVNNKSSLILDGVSQFDEGEYEKNHFNGITLNSSLSVSNSGLTGQLSISSGSFAFSGGEANLWVDDSQYANPWDIPPTIRVNRLSSFRLTNTFIFGSFRVTGQSRIELGPQVIQERIHHRNLVAGGSYLSAFGGSAGGPSLAETTFAEFSHGEAWNGQITEDLICETGSDFFCDDPGTFFPTDYTDDYESTCGLCQPE